MTAAPEAVAAKLREMGMSAAEAARVAGDLGAAGYKAPGSPRRSPSTLSLEHREAISRTRRFNGGRAGAREDVRPVAPETVAPPRPMPRPAPPPDVMRAPLCPRFGIVAVPGLHGVSVARVAFLDGPEAARGGRTGC